MKVKLRHLLVAVLVGMGFALQAAPKGQSPIVSTGEKGRLIYDADAQGNRVPDFSHCGYAGGDQAIPDAPVCVTVSPTSDDSTERIQKAIDYVASLPANTNGIHGAVLLLAGRHEVSGSLVLNVSGVVLRGQGAGENGTVIVATGKSRRTLIRIAGRNDLTTHTSSGWEIKDAYVPVGAMSFHVQDAGNLKKGDSIRVIRPSTQAWIDHLGMTEFGGGIGDWRLTWKPGSRDLAWDRVVQSVAGDQITIDAPITTALETNFGGGHIESYAWPGRVENIGVENLRCESTFDSGNPKDEEHSWMAMTVENAENIWVRQVTTTHFAGSLVSIWESCKWVTVQDCSSLAPVSEDGGYRRNTFFTMGQMTLFLRCWAEHGRHDFSVGHAAAGPNAFVQCEAGQALADSGAIESWASGVLFDNVRIDGNGLSLANRGSEGQGAGWSAANSVLWQCSAAFIRCANPPGAQNWAFGAWGEFEGNGIWRDANKFAKPTSLYVAQRAQRLSNAAPVLLMPRSLVEPDSDSDQVTGFVNASHQGAPELVNYIATASKRNPILTATDGAKRVEDISTPARAKKISSAHLLTVTNGWLTVDGKLLVGGLMNLRWWQGNIRPSEATKFGERLTRFVPGRNGDGFTDDLEEVAQTMKENGQVAIDYHYGLWYDRRREDHERVRRMNGDVWPPFYELPFARTGQGRAWDGLSQYDLTKFNPWYWNRLREFADICDREGLILCHQDYFQHNVLEAGAHWVDSPWRTTNNINGTGFPELPPFAGDKRIFMADQFYDTSVPQRRALHRNYIRQCLENFATNSNVIQFTSAEYTGPLGFVEFWLDTVAEWDKETGHKPLIALSCPKDVQDSILAEPQRSALVDIVCFRYWCITDKGLYAPKGGQNLAPRQAMHEGKAGTPTDLNLAKMAAEYRTRTPGKALIAMTEDNNYSRCSWAFLCAGGSMPNIPVSTDARLLAAIPRMQPWQSNDETKFWALREPGKGALVYSGRGSEAKIDLTGEQGIFTARAVSEKGVVSASGEQVQAGQVVTIKKNNNGQNVFWLTKD